jgi:hypothetical protein
MNKTVISIIILTVLALVFLTLVSFGPLKGLKKAPVPNPESLKPVVRNPTPPSAPTQASPPTPVAVTYNNVDVTENHYRVAVLQTWHVTAGDKPGSYSIAYQGGKGEIRLMDVPDNTTLELYLLSREEPRLKKEVAGYQRLDYQKSLINGNNSYKLVYEEGSETKLRTIAAYIVGPDQAAVVTLSAGAADFDSLRPGFDNLINSFEWKNK